MRRATIEIPANTPLKASDLYGRQYGRPLVVQAEQRQYRGRWERWQFIFLGIPHQLPHKSEKMVKFKRLRGWD